MANADPVEWLSRSWPWVSGWLTAVAALAHAIRSAYAAQRDREAFQRSELEKKRLEKQTEKLELEIDLLRNSPATVAKRQQLYDSLRGAVDKFLVSFEVSREQIGDLNKLAISG